MLSELAAIADGRQPADDQADQSLKELSPVVQSLLRKGVPAASIIAALAKLSVLSIEPKNFSQH